MLVICCVWTAKYTECSKYIHNTVCSVPRRCFMCVRLRSSAQTSIMCTCEWCLSRKKRNRLAHSYYGNCAWKLHKAAVDLLSGHDLSRASVCLVCNCYVGRNAWSKKSRPVYLPLDNDMRDLVNTKFGDYNDVSYGFATTVCYKCVRHLRSNRIKVPQHFADAKTRISAIFALSEIETGAAFVRPWCERDEPVDCQLCIVAQRQQSGGRNSTQKRSRAEQTVRAPRCSGCF